MKIAIIAPSPVPFTIGGAEKLWDGLHSHLNKVSAYQCELIKIPVQEDSFCNLISAYYAFYHLDLSHFDLVISGKYPAWMVKHENHHIYMLHTLRGLYDTYHFFNKPLEFESEHPQLKKILNFMNDNLHNLDGFFKLLFGLKNDSTIPSECLELPSPFVRKVIHFLDRKAMEGIKSFSAISQTVAIRKNYFPPGVEVKVIYPPSSLPRFENKGYDYFFTVSRLDGPKRIRMIVEAFLVSKTTIPLKIAGTGPLESELMDLAKGDPRIEFLGFVSDEELIGCYANAYAVIFVPYDEDYGLITIEAMMSHKPVITFSDSGGVTEFVDDAINGYVVPPDVDDLKNAIELISAKKKSIRLMGEKAFQSVNKITWESVTTNLINQCKSSHMGKKPKITVVSTYPFYPPRGGGQNRIFYLYKELAKKFNIEIVCLAHESEQFKKTEVAPGLFEIKVPKTQSHAEKEWKIQEKVGIPVTDIAMLSLAEETVPFVEAFLKSSLDADYIICCQPYTFEFVEKNRESKRIIQESQNVEYLLKKQMLPNNEYSKQLLNRLFKAEKRACLESFATMVCTDDDANTMDKLYGLEHSKVIEVPNGVDLASVSFTSHEQRMANKASIGQEGRTLALFMGSWHQPNIEAVEEIFRMAEILPQVLFLILGSVGNYFVGKQKPSNIGFMGIVDDDEKDFVLSLVDVALNPMLSGSGTNLKMLDYMAAGIPVISTKVGVRGLNLPVGTAVICDVGEFCNAIEKISNFSQTDEAREFVAKKYSWGIIARKLSEFL